MLGDRLTPGLSTLPVVGVAGTGTWMPVSTRAVTVCVSFPSMVHT